MTRPGVSGVPRRRRWFTTVSIIVLLIIVGLAVAVVVAQRVETGEWQVPKVDDLQRIVTFTPPGPSRTIFLERRPIEIRPGDNDAGMKRSSVLRDVRAKADAGKQPPPDPARPAKLPGWKGSEAAWKQVVACVTKQFEPFDVIVTDKPPIDGKDYVLVVVSGKPTDIGSADRRIGGLAPFNGAVIARPVVFAFGAQLGHDVRQVCETISMEVAHAYGLDHGYLCSDTMTYLKPCGAKRFVDKDVRCGELKARDCAGGSPTQNSYRRLLEVLGARAAAAPARK